MAPAEVLTSRAFPFLFPLQYLAVKVLHSEMKKAICCGFLFCFGFLWYWSLTSGLYTCKAGNLLLEPHLQSILRWLFWRWGLLNYLPRLAWLGTLILQISASQVARITGVSQTGACLNICILMKHDIPSVF
jgi:hypothetical protein